MQDDISQRLEVRRIAFSQGAILFDARSIPQATPALLTAGGWSDTTPLTGRGGRAAPVLVRADFGEGVLRHYHRGGLVGRVIRDRYLYTSESNVRSVREFNLLVELWQQAFPVPRPLLAGWRRHGMWYRAEIMTLRVEGATTLAQQMALARNIPWDEIGRVIASFHKAGVFHADLNAHNVLIDAAEKVWLIDFDRGEIRKSELSWQQSNIARFKRSLDKLGGISEACWQAFVSAYRDQLSA